MAAQNDTTSPTSPTGTPEERSTEFVPVEGGQETTSAEALLIVAYLLMWALVFGFLFLSFRRQRALDAKVSALEAAVSRAAAPKG